MPDEYRGRLFAMIYMAVMGTTALSIGLTRILLEKIGVEVLFFIIGIGAASTVFIGINTKIRNILINDLRDENI